MSLIQTFIILLPGEILYRRKLLPSYRSGFSLFLFVINPPIRPVSFADKLFHPSFSTLSNKPISSAISYFILSSGNNSPARYAFISFSLFKTAHTPFLWSMDCFLNFYTLFHCISSRQIFAIRFATCLIRLNFCLLQILLFFWNNNCSNNICPDSRTAKAGQNHPCQTHQRRVNIKIFCNSSTYTAKHAVF